MRKLPRFWQAIETVIGQEAVAACWRHLMGDEWPIARRWFRPTAELATHYPKLEPEPASPLDYRVVCHDEDADDFIGVCPEGTGDRALSRRDLVLYELDRKKLAGLLAAALDLIPDHAAIPDCPLAYRVGSHRPAAGEQVDVLLTAPPEPADLAEVVSHLIAWQQTPFVLLTPTKRLWRAWPPALRRDRRSDVVALSDICLISTDGSLVSRLSAADLLRGMAGQDEPLRRADGFHPPDVVAYRGREHECELAGKMILFLNKTIGQELTDAHSLMYRGRGSVWNRRYRSDKPSRDAISQMVSRLNALLSAATPPVPLVYSLVRGADAVRREDISFRNGAI